MKRQEDIDAPSEMDPSRAVMERREEIARTVTARLERVLPRDWAYLLDLDRVGEQVADAILALPEPPPSRGGEEELLDLLTAAYEQGCHDTHDNYQPDPSPEFYEAARDYALGVQLPSSPAPLAPDGASELTEALAALEIVAAASERSETMFGGKMSEVTRVFESITRVARQAAARLRGVR